MWRLLTPHLHLANVLELTVERVRGLGLDGLLLDVDCTLKPYRADSFGAEVLAWVKGMTAVGIRLCLLSNGKARRISRLAAALDLPFVAKALKPLPFGCWAGLKKLGLPASRAGVVGDQIFADVMAGRLAGLFTILVTPTLPEQEPWFTRLKRPLERCVLRWMNTPQAPIPK